MHRWYKNYEILTNTRHSQSHATAHLEQTGDLGVTGLRVRICCVSTPYTLGTESGDIMLLLLQLRCFPGHILTDKMKQLYLPQRKVVKIKCDLVEYLIPGKPLPLSSLVQTGSKTAKLRGKHQNGIHRKSFKEITGAGDSAQ